MSRWKYFEDHEVKNLVEDLVFKLDRARELFGAPIVITSGYRPPSHNATVGGVKDSAHQTGKAVDIRCADSELQKKLCWALGAAGFRRIGVYSGHVHADVDDLDKPTPAFWFGGPSK